MRPRIPFFIAGLIVASVTVVSVLRLQSLVHFANSTNPTWDDWEVSNWSTVEINVGIICACMPAIRVVLVRLFPRVLGTTRDNTNQHYAKYGSHTGPSRRFGGGSKRLSSKINADRSVITCTQTFEVRHADNDEVGLVEMDDLSGKEKVKSSSSSQVSI